MFSIKTGIFSEAKKRAECLEEIRVEMEERNGTTRAERAMADYAEFYEGTTAAPAEIPLMKKSAFGGNFGRSVHNTLKNRQTRHIGDDQERV